MEDGTSKEEGGEGVRKRRRRKSKEEERMVLMMEGSSMFPMREEKLDWQLIAALDPDTLGQNVLY